MPSASCSLILCCALLASLPACGPRDPQSAALKELARAGYTLSIEEYHRAAAAGDVKALALFLACGTRVDVPLSSGDGNKQTTALRAAVRHGHDAAAAWLLEQGAAIQKADTDADAPLLRLAVASSSEELVRRLLAHPDLPATSLEPLLLEAAALGETGIAEALLDQAPGLPLEPALRRAAEAGHLTVVDFLVQRGAVLDDADPGSGRPALMLAAGNGQRPVVELLLAAGASRFHAGHDSLLAADLAKESGHDEIAALLWRPPSPLERETGILPADPGQPPPQGWETATAPAIPLTPPASGQPRPLAPLHHAIAGHHSGLATPPPPRRRIELHSVRPRQLPFRLFSLATETDQAVLEDLTLPGPERYVRPGNAIGDSGWRLAEIRAATSERPLPEWLSALAIVEHAGSGSRLALIPETAARHGPLSAVLHITGTDEFYEAHPGDTFRFTTSPAAFTLTAIHQRRVEITDSEGVFEVALKPQ